MTNSQRGVREGQSWFERLAVLMAAGLFIILGVIGLVVPVIPGVIFLVVAAVLLARVSDRMDRWVKQNTFARQAQARVATMASLNWPDRIKVTLWYTASAVIKVLATIGRQLNKLKA